MYSGFRKIAAAASQMYGPPAPYSDTTKTIATGAPSGNKLNKISPIVKTRGNFFTRLFHHGSSAVNKPASTTNGPLTGKGLQQNTYNRQQIDAVNKALAEYGS